MTIIYPRTGREYLESIKAMRLELASLEEEKRGFISQFYTVSSPAPDKEKVTGGEMHGLEVKVEKILEYRARLDLECQQLTEALIQASDLIGKVKDGQARAYLRAYYINFHSFREMADEFYISRTKAMYELERAKDDFEEVYREEVLKNV